MAHEFDIEPDAKIAIVRCSGAFTLAEHLTVAQQLITDASIDPSYGLIFDFSHVSAPPTAEDLLPIAEALRALKHKFPHRKAIVATLPGFVSLSEMIAILAGDGELEAFTSDAAARRWIAQPAV